MWLLWKDNFSTPRSSLHLSCRLPPFRLLSTSLNNLKLSQEESQNHGLLDLTPPAYTPLPISLHLPLSLSPSLLQLPLPPCWFMDPPATFPGQDLCSCIPSAWNTHLHIPAVLFLLRKPSGATCTWNLDIAAFGTSFVATSRPLEERSTRALTQPRRFWVIPSPKQYMRAWEGVLGSMFKEYSVEI